MSPQTAQKKLKENVVHESEVQRQHVRVELPCLCYIDKKSYKVTNISLGGFQIKTDRDFKNNKETEVKILFPLKDMAFHTKLSAQQVYYLKDKGLAGFRFTNLEKKQLSLIRSIIQNYMAGVLSSENDIINVVTRNDYTAPRPQLHTVNDNRSRWRKILPMTLITAGGLLGAFLIAGNIYENTHIVKSYTGVVDADKFTVRAIANGTYFSLLAEGTQNVTKGQPLAVIRSQEYESSQASEMLPPQPPQAGKDVVLKSPCDCIVTQKFAQEGEFRALGEPVYELLPIDNQPWIRATVSPQEAHRLKIYDDVKIRVAGESAFINGTITAFLPPGPEQDVAAVRIRAEQEIPKPLIGRPAYAEFLVY